MNVDGTNLLLCINVIPVWIWWLRKVKWATFISCHRYCCDVRSLKNKFNFSWINHLTKNLRVHTTFDINSQFTAVQYPILQHIHCGFRGCQTKFERNMSQIHQFFGNFSTWDYWIKLSFLQNVLDKVWMYVNRCQDQLTKAPRDQSNKNNEKAVTSRQWGTFDAHQEHYMHRPATKTAISLK